MAPDPTTLAEAASGSDTRLRRLVGGNVGLCYAHDSTAGSDNMGRS